MIKKVELLAPAKNKECAFAAIDHGADAVYMGPSLYGARAAAGNSVEDICQVARYAHVYGVKIFITLNTLLLPEELDGVRKMARQLCDVGADAFIVQDRRILQMRNRGEIPPIEIHASTQMDNRTPQKVQQLQVEGFDRVVLARELNLEQIAAISSQCSVPLEAFVHGALCVSYSGRCYMSEALCGRSANRGACAQFCRLPYSLVDAEGHVLIKDKHLLSLKDMDRSSSLLAMMQAGITSFKIEGRLKDPQYVKNCTAYYRQKLDALLETDSGASAEHYQRTSWGRSVFFFTPQPQKTFHRGQTTFFPASDGTFAQPVHQWDTPKSTGEFIGTVKKMVPGGLQLDLTDALREEGGLHNGDGICFTNAFGQFEGLRVNTVREGSTVFPFEWRKGTQLSRSDVPRCLPSTPVFRNRDYAFEQLLAGKSAERKISVDLEFFAGAGDSGFCLKATACLEGVRADVTVEDYLDLPHEPCRDQQKAAEAIRAVLSKCGETVFCVRNLLPKERFDWFVPVSRITVLRREVLQQLEQKLADNAVEAEGRLSVYDFAHEGAALLEGPDTEPQSYPMTKGLALMTCKYCIRHAMGYCPKLPSDKKRPPLAEPLYLLTASHRCRLEFDCAHCQMKVWAE